MASTIFTNKKNFTSGAITSTAATDGTHPFQIFVDGTLTENSAVQKGIVKILVEDDNGNFREYPQYMFDGPLIKDLTFLVSKSIKVSVEDCVNVTVQVDTP